MSSCKESVVNEASLSFLSLHLQYVCNLVQTLHWPIYINGNVTCSSYCLETVHITSSPFRSPYMGSVHCAISSVVSTTVQASEMECSPGSLWHRKVNLKGHLQVNCPHVLRVSSTCWHGWRNVNSASSWSSITWTHSGVYDVTFAG